LGLKVDAAAIPANVVAAIKTGKVDLNDPAVTVTLLKLNAVVGVKGFFQGDRLSSVGLTCASSATRASMIPSLRGSGGAWTAVRIKT
jgi:hypothetical protein